MFCFLLLFERRGHMNTIAKRIIELRKEGHTYKAIHDELNISQDKIRYWCRKAGLTADTGHQSFKSREDWLKRFAEMYPEVELISEYTNAHEPVILRCKRCGYEHKRKLDHLPKELCPECRRVLKEKEAEMKRLKAEERKAELKKQKEEQRRQATEQRRIEAEALKASRYHVIHCEVCNKEILTNKSNKKYCSIECFNRASNRQVSLKRRLKDLDIEKDWSINLSELMRRDNEVCHICGGKIDLNDYTIENGIFKVGKDYPSIDHVIPVTKGGNHTWDNVKLAHIGCNAKKGND